MKAKHLSKGRTRLAGFGLLLAVVLVAIASYAVQDIRLVWVNGVFWGFYTVWVVRNAYEFFYPKSEEEDVLEAEIRLSDEEFERFGVLLEDIKQNREKEQSP